MLEDVRGWHKLRREVSRYAVVGLFTPHTPPSSAQLLYQDCFNDFFYYILQTHAWKGVHMGGD